MKPHRANFTGLLSWLSRLNSLFIKEDPQLNSMLRSMEQSHKESEKRRVTDLEIRISAKELTKDRYLVSVKNLGRKTYTNLSIPYENILLIAYNFGRETYGMRPGEDCKSGEPIFIKSLDAGQALFFERPGYDNHSTYDVQRSQILSLSFVWDGKSFTKEYQRWCYVVVELPNAT
jgi:hypothetical protein